MKTTLSAIKKQLESWRKQKSIFPVQLILMLFLILYTPLAYGSVELWAILLIETTIILLFFSHILNFLLKDHINLRYTPYIWGTLLFFLFILFTLPFSTYTYDTIKSLTLITTYILLFVFVINVYNTTKKLLFLVWTIGLFGSFYAISALLFRYGNFFGYKIFSNSEHINLTFVNRNHFAGYLEMIIWLVVGLGIIKKGAWRILFFALSLIIAFALFMSLSRGGIISLLSSFAFFNILYAIRIKKKIIIGYSIAFATLLLIFLFTIDLEPIINRFEKVQVETMGEIGRIEYWKSSYALIKDKPWFGSGLGTFSTAVPRFQTQNAKNLFISHSHNDYLELFSELGIIGFLIVIITFFSFFYSLIQGIFIVKSRKKALIGLAALSSIFSILIHSIFDFNFHIPSNALLFSVLVAIAYLSTSDKTKEIVISNKLYKRSRIIFSLLLIVLLLASISFVSKPYIAEKYIETAKQEANAKQYTLAIRDINKAIHAETNNAAHYVSMADVLVRNSKDSSIDSLKNSMMLAALDQFEIALERNPNYGYYHLKRAYLLNSLGREESAKEAYKSAILCSPTSSSYRYSLTNLYFKQNEIKLAIEQSIKVLLLDNNYFHSILKQYIKHGISYDSIDKILPETVLVRNKYISYLRQEKLDTLLVKELIKLYELEPCEKNAEKHIRYSFRLKNDKEQLVVCKKYLKEYPNSINLKKGLARIYINLGELSKAKNIYYQLIENNPYDASLHYSISTIYRKEKNIEKLLNSLKKAINLAPNNDQYRFALGREYQRQGLFQLAISEFKACLKLNPEQKKYSLAIEKIKERVEN